MVSFLLPFILGFNLIEHAVTKASKVFSSMAVFDILRNLLHHSSRNLATCIRAKVSLDRIGSFLRDTELLDAHVDTLVDKKRAGAPNGLEHDDHEGVIGFHNATFTWSKEMDGGTQTPSSRLFRLRTEHLVFKRGVVNLIVGPT